MIDLETKKPEALSLEQALKRAENMKLDLVQVGQDNNNTPICKLMSYSKFVYEKRKKSKQKMSKSRSKGPDTKELRLRPSISSHDFENRISQLTKFLQDGDRVKITVRFKGREIVHTELGMQIVERILARVNDLCIIDQKPKLEGKQITMMLSPQK